MVTLLLLLIINYYNYYEYEVNKYDKISDKKERNTWTMTINVASTVGRHIQYSKIINKRNINNNYNMTARFMLGAIHFIVIIISPFINDIHTNK